MTPPPAALARFLSSSEDGVFYMGHASVLVRIAGKRLLFDYVKNNKPYGNLWRFFPELVGGLDLDVLDGIVVSHMHQDHFDTPFLQQLGQRCPLYVLDGRPEFNALLQQAGLSPVLIPPDTRYAIGDDLELYGVLHESNGVDGSMAIASSRFSAYHGNDNYCQPERLAVLKRLYGGIDVGCIPYAYINWYPFLLDDLTPDEKAREAERLVHHYYDLAIAQADAMGARVVIPFGANLVYHDDAFSAMNLAVKTPLEFEAYACRRLGTVAGQRFKALFGGDQVMAAGAGSAGSAGPRVIAHDFDRRRYRDMMQVHLQRLAAEQDVAAPGSAAVDLARELPRIAQRVAGIAPLGAPHEIRVQSRDGSVPPLAIDLQRGTVEQRAASSAAPGSGGSGGSVPYHLFRVEDGVLSQWLRDEIRFEEIIGSRKFTLSRVPNVYDPEILRIVSASL